MLSDSTIQTNGSCFYITVELNKEGKRTDLNELHLHNGKAWIDKKLTTFLNL